MLALGLGYLAHAVPWNDRCTEGRALDACATGDVEPGLRTVLATMDARLLALGAFVYALGAPLWAARWRFVLSVAPSSPPYVVLFRASVEAYAAMALFVGGIGGDAVRLGTLVSQGLPTPWAVASLGVDRAIGLAALVTAALLVAAPELVALSHVLGLLLPAGLVALVCGLAAVLLAPIPRACPGSVRRFVEAVRGPYGTAPARLGLMALLQAFATSLGVAATQLGAFACFLAAAHAAPPSVARVVAGIVETFVVGAIPTVPGGWGTGEAACVFFLEPAGIREAQALAASVAFRLSVFPVAALGVLSAALRAKGRGQST